MAALVDIQEREKELKAFEESKAGVKGLADAGLTKLPKMFIHPPENMLTYSGDLKDLDLQIPVIDLNGFENNERRLQLVKDINNAAESWGLFQLINHGIPIGILEDIQKSIRRFHELPQAEKATWYSLDFSKKVNFFSFHGDFKVMTPVDWRDTLTLKVLEDPRNFDEIPEVCRQEVRKYMKYMDGVVEILSELFSEALGVDSKHLANMDCFKSRSLACHYFPLCPEPHLTMGGTKHSDLGFFTLLLQDAVGGLQAHYKDVWIDVPPVKGALLVNVGDMMQIISNGKYKSVEHRVLLRASEEPRISIACFISTNGLERPYGPIKELLSKINPPKYKPVKFGEYGKKYKH